MPYDFLDTYCCKQYFNVNVVDEEQKAAFSLYPSSLTEVYSAGKTEHKFQQYLDLLRKKDYFKGAEPDTPGLHSHGA